jgi:hypothetical protein
MLDSKGSPFLAISTFRVMALVELGIVALVDLTQRVPPSRYLVEKPSVRTKTVRPEALLEGSSRTDNPWGEKGWALWWWVHCA